MLSLSIKQVFISLGKVFTSDSPCVVYTHACEYNLGREIYTERGLQLQVYWVVKVTGDGYLAGSGRKLPLPLGDEWGREVVGR